MNPIGFRIIRIEKNPSEFNLNINPIRINSDRIRIGWIFRIISELDEYEFQIIFQVRIIFWIRINSGLGPFYNDHKKIMKFVINEHNTEFFFLKRKHRNDIDKIHAGIF